MSSLSIKMVTNSIWYPFPTKIINQSFSKVAVAAKRNPFPRKGSTVVLVATALVCLVLLCGAIAIFDATFIFLFFTGGFEGSPLLDGELASFLTTVLLRFFKQTNSKIIRINLMRRALYRRLPQRV
jgi:hypothetical protein